MPNRRNCSSGWRHCATSKSHREQKASSIESSRHSVNELFMRSPWFWAPPQMWAESVIGLPPDEARHALRVLRLQSGDQVTVTDGRGRIAQCKLAQRTEELVEAEISEVEEQPRAKPD